MLEKIKPEELVGKGVIGLPDTPKLTAEEMQKKFEETAREVIVPKYNALVEALLSAEAAGLLGAADPENGEKSTVQAVLAALLEKIESKKDELETAVRTVPQELTLEQQEQARTNIAALGTDEYISWFDVGESIPEGADLDDYKANGKYYVSSEARAKTLLNRPEGMNTNFCMWVFQRTTAAIYSQLLLTLHGKLYCRSSNSSRWNAWVEYATEKEVASLLEGTKEELLAQIVHADWNENDPLSRAYVRNRPVYLAPGEVLVQEQAVMVANDELNVRIDGDFTFVPGRMYEVTFDGEPYDCFAYTASVSGGTVLGDLGVNPDAGMEGENRGSGEPFAVIAGDNGVWLYTEKQGEFRIKIADPEGEGNMVVIDERYRGAFGVNANWAQNDPTAPDYIKNRPFYGENAGIAETITTEDGGGYGYGEIAGELLLEAGKAYTVTLDGTAYECKAYTIGNSDGADAYTALGNSALAVQEMPEAVNYPPATDEPFAIVDWGGGDLSLYTEEAGTYAVELGEKGSFARLDEKYLPLTVLLATEQKLTEEQQEQVRENIGVGKGGGSGEDGFSPIAMVERTETGAVITITDKTGTTEAEIMDGKDGEDGVSPSVGISKAGKVTTISITDADGTQTEEIVDGEDGKDGVDGVGIAYVEDPGDGTMEVWSTKETLLGVIPLPKGKDGASVTVESVSESTVDGGRNEVTFSDGKKVVILNGKTGKDGLGIAYIEETPNGQMEIWGTNEEMLALIDLPQGPKGDTGVGIDYIVVLEDYTMEIWGTNGEMLKAVELPKGPKGDDGISPTVGVSKNGKVTTVTITDKDGKKTVTINDGEDGVGIASVDDPGDGTAEFFGTNGEILGVVTLPKGKAGDDGISPTVGISKSGKVTTISITDADGTQTEEIIDGEDGKAGTSVTVSNVSESSASGGTNTVTFSDGKKLDVKNGKDGAPGKTPVKGVDYLTEAELEAIVQQVITALGTPVFGRVDADKNIILTGELADGTYTVKYEDKEGELVDIGTLDTSPPDDPNMLHRAVDADGNLYNNGLGWKANTRLNSSGGETAYDNIEVTGFIPVTLGDVVRFKNIKITPNGGATYNQQEYLAFYDADKKLLATGLVANLAPGGVVADGVVREAGTRYLIEFDTSKLVAWSSTSNKWTGAANMAYFRISAEEISEASIITINQPIE